MDKFIRPTWFAIGFVCLLIVAGFMLAEPAQAADPDYNAAKRTIRDFEWPDDNCGSPVKFGINASEWRVNRANKHNREWFDCLASRKQRDWKAFRGLIDDLEGIGAYWEWTNRADKTFEFYMPPDCINCEDALWQIAHEVPVRQESRREIVKSFNRWVHNRDEEIANAEFWDGINDSVNQFSKDMEEMRRQRQEMLDGIIYISPGYL